MKIKIKFFAFFLCFLLLIVCLSGTKPATSKPEAQEIGLRVSKIYTVGNSVKCYELVPTGKYKDLNKVVITGDPGISELTLDKHVTLVVN